VGGDAGKIFALIADWKCNLLILEFWLGPRFRLLKGLLDCLREVVEVGTGGVKIDRQGIITGDHIQDGKMAGGFTFEKRLVSGQDAHGNGGVDGVSQRPAEAGFSYEIVLHIRLQSLSAVAWTDPGEGNRELDFVLMAVLLTEQVGKRGRIVNSIQVAWFCRFVILMWSKRLEAASAFLCDSSGCGASLSIDIVYCRPILRGRRIPEPPVPGTQPRPTPKGVSPPIPACLIKLRDAPFRLRSSCRGGRGMVFKGFME
jgi:hypothetical protein